ncbi:MAG: carbon monoxide dehydrogenase subunit G [Rhodospirillaceae bacterium]|nr:carbon monoxide dehydrogenase subunit G [Rhodospirillaceae bacterium]
MRAEIIQPSTTFATRQAAAIATAHAGRRTRAIMPNRLPRAKKNRIVGLATVHRYCAAWAPTCESTHSDAVARGDDKNGHLPPIGYDCAATLANQGDVMDLTGEYRIAAPRAVVWKALNDPEILRAAIPGCESLEKVSDTEMTAKVAIKIGPVSAKFAGKVTLSDLDPPKGYRITGEGQGGAAGFARGTAQVTLEEDGGATVLRYNADASVGGKMAQIGSRLVQGAAQKTANEFFGRFSELVADSDAARNAPPAEMPATVAATNPSAETAMDAPTKPAHTVTVADDGPRRSLSPWAWIGGLVVIVALLLAWFEFAD